jgi:magnesium-transporting ATPase (P-type)
MAQRSKTVSRVDSKKIYATIPYYLQSVEQVLLELEVQQNSGLSSEEAEKRINEHGHNVLPSVKGKTAFERIWEQVNSVLTYVLCVGAILSIVFNHIVDAVVIALVVVINVTLGYFMEAKAENSTKVLKGMLSASALVLRDNEKVLMNASMITVGDIFYLQPGDICPADGRVLSSFDLCVLEAPLTGEAHAVLSIIMFLILFSLIF